ncbi:hypothetical protein KIN20_021897 [Parelaphostrongylus tenuis]|uniref:Uncharacterized protein n=1 Tax=Parelaphostrongylus tenuis TaxID=148309 RepID=A0AAD5N7I0_PARTN|nr:hypothetical protein KIN20_021897 [Parelaphostrongylus tenuis]
MLKVDSSLESGLVNHPNSSHYAVVALDWMAFYFALLNVSAKREDRSTSSSSHRQRRRRHSIASVESPILDYRLLPRPQVVGNQAYHAEPQAETSSRHNEHRSTSYSRLYDETSRREMNFKRSPKRNPKEIRYKKMKKSSSTHFSSPRRPGYKAENRMEKEFGKLKVESSPTSKGDYSETIR